MYLHVAYRYLFSCRRQTAEEREAERQAANRLMMSIQAEVVSKSIYDQSRDPLCISNASLHALQTLQPWASESAAHAAVAASHHQASVDRASFLAPPPHSLSSPICWNRLLWMKQTRIDSIFCTVRDKTHLIAEIGLRVWSRRMDNSSTSSETINNQWRILAVILVRLKFNCL